MTELDFATTWLNEKGIEYSLDGEGNDTIVHFEYEGLKYNVFRHAESDTCFISHSEHVYIWEMGKILSAMFDILGKCFFVRPKLHAVRQKISLTIASHRQPHDPSSWITASIKDIQLAVDLIRANFPDD